MVETVMCRGCGEFTPASIKDGVRVPMKDACPQCGGQEFKDIHEDRVVVTGGEEQPADNRDRVGAGGE